MITSTPNTAISKPAICRPDIGVFRKIRDRITRKIGPVTSNSPMSMAEAVRPA